MERKGERTLSFAGGKSSAQKAQKEIVAGKIVLYGNGGAADFISGMGLLGSVSREYASANTDMGTTKELYDCAGYLSLENQKKEKTECDVFAYTEFSKLAFENEVKLGYYLKWNVDNRYDEELESILYLYTSWIQVDTKKTPLVYFSSSQPCDSFCCNRDLFCGNYRDERNPIGVEKGKLDNANMPGGEPCGALHSHI